MDVNLLDIVLIGIILVSISLSVYNGITKELVRISSLVGGIFLAFWGYPILADLMRLFVADFRWASGVAFFLIFLACMMTGALLTTSLRMFWKWTDLQWVDRLIGAGFGLLRGILVSGVLLTALIAFRPTSAFSSIVTESKIAPQVVNVGRVAVAIAPKKIKEAFREGFKELKKQWTGKDNKV